MYYYIKVKQSQRIACFGGKSQKISNYPQFSLVRLPPSRSSWVGLTVWRAVTRDLAWVRSLCHSPSSFAEAPRRNNIACRITFPWHTLFAQIFDLIRLRACTLYRLFIVYLFISFIMFRHMLLLPWRRHNAHWQFVHNVLCKVSRALTTMGLSIYGVQVRMWNIEPRLLMEQYGPMTVSGPFQSSLEGPEPPLRPEFCWCFEVFTSFTSLMYPLTIEYHLRLIQ